MIAPNSSSDRLAKLSRCSGRGGAEIRNTVPMLIFRNDANKFIQIGLQELSFSLYARTISQQYRPCSLSRHCHVRTQTDQSHTDESVISLQPNYLALQTLEGTPENASSSICASNTSSLCHASYIRVCHCRHVSHFRQRRAPSQKPSSCFEMCNSRRWQVQYLQRQVDFYCPAALVQASYFVESGGCLYCDAHCTRSPPACISSSSSSVARARRSPSLVGSIFSS